MNNELKHYGTPRHSGRYPWGSGEEPYQGSKSWLGEVEEMRRQGKSDNEIAEGMGLNSTEFRNQLAIARRESRAGDVSQALRLRNEGHSTMEIGRRMGVNESTVRNWLDPAIQERAEITKTTMNILKDQIEKKGVLDVGAGVERHIGVTRDKLKKAIYELEAEGYKTHYIRVPQVGNPGKYTRVMAISGPDVEWKDIAKDISLIKSISDYSDDGGRSWQGLRPVQSINSDRVMIRYFEDGGTDKDGVIELRRGVEDLDLGEKRYAQVRIGVDDTHFMKGMAIYTDKELPPGVDVVYNTNKHKDIPKMEVFKAMKTTSDGSIDQENPFGSTIKRDDEGVSRQVGALNICSEEGDWHKWSKTISSQMLSKQSEKLAKKQLDLAYDVANDEFKEILSLTNPEVKKHLLSEFADGCDADAEHLQAAGMPRQAWKVILPVPEMKETEVYAPAFNNGEQVVLIRHPHGGIFEIPQLTVNNKSKNARSIMGNDATDAIGIHPKVAQKLSGADFDGDTVLVIPNNEGYIKTAPSLEGLSTFDTRESYPPFDGMKTIDGGRYNAATRKVEYTTKGPTSNMQSKMGEVSNLITDMTIKGANQNEIARAVRYSMVVIDAEKHHLNYKQSYLDEQIASLKKVYQDGGGASTIISRARSEIRVPERRETSRVDPNTGKRTPIDPETGRKLYRNTDRTYEETVINKRTGEKVVTTKGYTTKTTRMAEATDAHALSSGRPIEIVYADYANQMKGLANQARLTIESTPSRVYSPSARKAYQTEVASLNYKLNIALKAAPLERKAQVLANTTVDRKMQDNPSLKNDPATLKKVKNQALAEARVRTGSKKSMIEITAREWEAIQAGAVSSNFLNQVLKNTDSALVKQLATPRERPSMSQAQVTRAKTMLASGCTQAEVAEALGVSTSTIQNAIS